MKINEVLSEAKDNFDNVDVIKLDPDRVDVYDIVQALLPTLCRIAYTNLIEDRVRYERTHTDEEDEKFDFSKDALEEKFEDLVGHIVNRLNDLTGHDFEYAYRQVKDDLKEKLTED